MLTVVASGVWLSMRPDRRADNTKLQVAASFYPLYDFARQVGGDKVQVINITPSGMEPHDYEPSAKDLTRLLQSDVFVYNGVMEPWAAGFLQGYKGKVVKASDGMELLGGSDPHFWLDPVLAEKIVRHVQRTLLEADPSNGDYYAKRAQDYILKLQKLDQDFSDAMASCTVQDVVVSHNAFSYAAKRYKFNILSIAGVSPEIEPSPARLAELTKIVKERQIKYVLFETLVSPRLADTIAKETGASTLVLDPLEGLRNEDQQQGKDYISVQRENLATLRRARACQ